ncbi:hypothetical protein APY04_0840 [Hyphomicrobium sulfonivorans]|uniref:Uncharacterized protein n=1 Tax=Hyphomicrobium sulfonivorans TaxID=121290 RepID=A0A109BL58_HYPSL|nr:hypothetical protein [Hyphomicrobium sulfonivorans]KWT70779.1 hypothetical protein APY04_0840 [Hyphomicrobium sulfonivorans]
MSNDRVLQYVEIDILQCQLAYGVAPCTAVLGVDSDIKCWNTRQTCAKPNDFSGHVVTLRFAVDTGFLPADIPCIPSLQSVQYTPGRLSLGENLGQRTSARVVFKDHPWGDGGDAYDKYVTERDYNPFERGTYWGKLRARHRSWQGRSIRLITGFVGQTLEEMDTRHLIVDSWDGPLPDGTFAIIAKDILKLADGDRSMTPPLSPGYLLSAINASQTTATLSPSGIGNAAYPASGFVTIGGSEVCAFTRSGNTLTLTRGAKGTPATAHDAEDRVQVMRSWVSQSPSAILRNLLQDDAKIDAGWLPVSEWVAEEEAFLQRTYSRDIPEPTPTEKVVADLIQQAGLCVWPDDKARKVRMQVLRGVPSDAATFSPDRIVEKSLSIKDQPNSRISQSIVRYGLRNPLLRVDDALSYRSAYQGVDGDSEVFYGSDVIKEINGTFLPPYAVDTAKRVSDIIQGRFSNPPRLISFDLSRADPNIPEVGQGARFAWPKITQDVTGLDVGTPMQIVRVNRMGRRVEVEAEEMLVKIFDLDDLKNRKLLINTNEYNLNIPAMHNAAYPPLTEADVADGVNLQVIVAPGVIVGSRIATAAGIAMQFGATGTDWPPGFLIALICNGWIRGKGGLGGKGANVATNDAGSGQAGGTALHTRHPLAIDLPPTGEIKGGGGGGGGGCSTIANTGSKHAAYAPGGGAGGGAGAEDSTPGAAGTGNFPGGHGAPGSATNGGAAGAGGRAQMSDTGALYDTSTFPIRGGNGGAGGAPGSPGSAGSTGSFSPIHGGSYSPVGPGGAAGRAIDGISFCTFSANAGQRAGPDVN